MIEYIIVHGGRAHLDDVMACALAMARKGQRHDGDNVSAALADLDGPVPIYRRDPSEEEMADERVLVLDVGRDYDPARGHFDHHQLSRETTECAMSLLAKSIRVPAGDGELFGNFLPKIFGWWETAVEIDQHGPYAAARKVGLEWKDVSPFVGPLSSVFLGMFEDFKDGFSRGVFVYRTVTKMIDEKVEAYFDIADNLESSMAGEVEVLDFMKANPETCEDASSAFISRLGGGVAVFCARPRRDGESWSTTGMTLMRIADDPRIDFNRVRGETGVSFVHSGGFLCQVDVRDIERARELVRLATGKAVA